MNWLPEWRERELSAEQTNAGTKTDNQQILRHEHSHRLAPELLLLIAAVAIGLWVFWTLWEILLIIVMSLILAGTISPLVHRMEQRGLHRGLALGLVFVALLALVGIAGFFIIPAIAAQILAIITDLPRLQTQLADLLARLGPFQKQADQLRGLNVEDLVQGSGATALHYVSATIEFFAYALTTVVLAFYLVADRERTTGFVYALIPRRFHVRLARVLLDMETIVGGYVRGQAFTSAGMTLFMFGLLWAVGLRNPLAFAALAAFADLIPFIGGILITVPATLAALALGPTQAAIVFVATILYQEFESRVLVPRVYGKFLRLSPVAVTVALLIGGKLLGVLGALIALPLAASIRVLIEDLRIQLPGDESGAREGSAAAQYAEDFYAASAEGATVVQAAAVANALAGVVQEAEEAQTGNTTQPATERTIPEHSDTSPITTDPPAIEEATDNYAVEIERAAQEALEKFAEEGASREARQQGEDPPASATDTPPATTPDSAARTRPTDQ